MKCVGAAQTCQRQRCVSLLVAGGLGDEHRCRDGSVLSMRIRGGREGGRGARGGGEKEKGGRGVKGIYCQEPSISGNGYACIGVNQTCCFSSSVPEVNKTPKV